MAEWSKQKSIFPVTYSKKGKRPLQLISINTANLKTLPENVEESTQSSTDSNQDSQDELQVTSDSSSSQCSENSHFLSLTRSHSKSSLKSPVRNIGRSQSKDEPLQRNRKGPFRLKQNIKYSIILEEESSDSQKLTVPIKKPVQDYQTASKLHPVDKKSTFERKMSQTTKLTKDSLMQVSDSTEDCFNDSNFLTIDSTGYLTEDNEATTATESYIPHVGSGSTDIVKSLNRQEILADYDIEVMRDAPVIKSAGEGPKDKNVITTDSLKISPVRLHLPHLVSKSNIYHKKRTHTTGRKNSTLLEENLSAKDIQEVSFFNDVSDISGSNPVTSSEEGISEEDAFSTLKRTVLSGSNLKANATSTIQRGPTLRVAKGDQGGYIKTPKRHSIKRAVEKLPSVKLDGKQSRQVSFNKVNEESIYEPGVKMKLSPAVLSNSLPKLSPSVSILKKAVSTLTFEPSEEENELLKATTSTPIFKRRSRNKPNLMDLSFELSSVPLPSYNDNDLMTPASNEVLVSEKQPNHENKSPWCHTKHSTPSQQMKRESSDESIPCRPSKRRCAHLLCSSSGSTDDEYVKKKSERIELKAKTKQKRLEYRDVTDGPEECIITKLSDSIFYNHSATKQSSNKISAGLSVNASFFEGVPLDVLTVIPDCLFQ